MRSTASRTSQVSDADAKRYYDAHPDNPDWSMDERIQISVIAVNNKADLDRALSGLLSNAKFADVARAIPRASAASQRSRQPVVYPQGSHRAARTCPSRRRYWSVPSSLRSATSAIRR